MAKRLFLEAAVFLIAGCAIVVAQNFSVYVGGLPAATSPFASTDVIYVLQGTGVNATSKQVPAFSVMGKDQVYTIATLPTCNVSTNVGLHASISNGAASQPLGGAVGATGAVFVAVTCSGSGGWVYG